MACPSVPLLPALAQEWHCWHSLVTGTGMGSQGLAPAGSVHLMWGHCSTPNESMGARIRLRSGRPNRGPIQTEGTLALAIAQFNIKNVAKSAVRLQTVPQGYLGGCDK